MYEDYFPDFSILYKQLAESLKPIYSTQYILESINSIQPTMREIVDLLQNDNYIAGASEFLNSLNMLIYAMPTLNIQALSESLCVVSNELYNIVSNALLDAAPFMTEEQRIECSDVIEPIASDMKKSGVTFEKIMIFFTFLLGLYTAILATLPNEQLEKLANQQNTIIEQQEEIVEELHKINDNDDELVQAINSLSTAIVALSDEMELLRDENDALIDEVESLRNQTEESQNFNNDESKGQASDP